MATISPCEFSLSPPPYVALLFLLGGYLGEVSGTTLTLQSFPSDILTSRNALCLDGSAGSEC
eukprot:313734-Amorphochlora_amoeboformis.AAC.1